MQIMTLTATSRLQGALQMSQAPFSVLLFFSLVIGALLIRTQPAIFVAIVITSLLFSLLAWNLCPRNVFLVIAGLSGLAIPLYFTDADLARRARHTQKQTVNGLKVSKRS